MIQFRDISIKSKLILIILSVSLIGILSAFSGFVYVQYNTMRARWIEEHKSLAQWIGYNCGPALTFNEPLDADDQLSYMKNNDALERIIVYDLEGARFAALPSDTEIEEPPAGPVQEFREKYLYVYDDIFYKGERMGSIAVYVKFDLLQSILDQNLKVSLIVLVSALGLIFLLASRVHLPITRPIMHLARTTERVSRDKNYGVRAVNLAGGEIGVLIEGFNEMLAHIQDRDTALVQANEKYRSIFENATEGIFQISLDGHFLTVNPAFLDIMGYETAEEFLASGRTGEQVLGREILDMAREGKVLEHITHILNKVGNAVPISVNLHVVMDNKRNHNFFEGSIKDISHRMRAKELEVQKEAAEASSSAKSSFLANMSHEIRTPMNAVIALTRLALRQTDPDPRTLRGYLEIIDTSSQSLLGIINDILDFSKIEAGKLELEYREFSMQEVLDNLCIMFSGKAAEKGVELIVTQSPQLPRRFIGDPLRISQVLINLVSNAVKFTSQGEVLVRVSGEREGNNEKIPLQFSIKDSGTGIDQETVDKLFQPFTQADESITRKHGGTGLGLAISHHLVQLMGGTISVDSTPGHGSTFKFTLPLNAPFEEPAAPLAGGDLTGLRVLVIDDSYSARQAMSDSLESFTFKADIASGGQEGLEMLKKNSQPYDLVIVDLHMPEMDGREVVDGIRADDRYRQVPVIMMVPFSGDGQTGESERHGADALLAKPIKISTLLETILELLGKGGTRLVSHRTSDSAETTILERIAGAHVLLVEDNEINQQVAMEVLQTAGLKVDVVDSGRAAIVAVSTRDNFDAVLMDIQMPEMDGFEATRHIRRQHLGDKLPIIAMTAHALKGDREKCLEAGMNDYLTKPIDPVELYTVLSRWVEPKKGRTAVVAEPKEKDGPELPTELPGFEISEGLRRVAMNTQLYRDLLLAFAGKYGDASREIKARLDAGEHTEAAKLLHALRGAAGNLGANRTAVEARALENVLRGHAEGNIEELFKTFASAMEAAIAGTDLLRKEEPSEIVHSPAKPVQEVLQLIKGLDTQLTANDMEAGTTMDELRKALGERYGDLAAELAEHVENLDFDCGLETLGRLRGALETERGTP
ncbi:MAG: response regulator [Acidobacteriota bacterium]|nr:response regulator [Acidobacteriota bacterium]